MTKEQLYRKWQSSDAVARVLTIECSEKGARIKKLECDLEEKCERIAVLQRQLDAALGRDALGEEE